MESRGGASEFRSTADGPGLPLAPLRLVASIICAIVMLARPAYGGEHSEGAPVMRPPARALADLAARAGRAFDNKRFAEAGVLYRRWAALSHDDGHPLVMAGIASAALGDEEQARTDLERALARPLSGEDRDLVEMYREILDDEGSDVSDSLDDDKPVESGSLSLVSTLRSGWDGNARFLSPGDLEAATEEGQAAAAGYASAGLGLAADWELDDESSVSFGYEIEQSFYFDRALSDLASQDHTADLRFDHYATTWLQLALTATGDLSFTGLVDDLHAYGRSLSLEPEVTVGSRRLRFRVGAAWQQSETLDPAVSFLSGRRLEARLAPELDLLGFRASLQGKLRRDDIGANRIAIDGDDASPPCPTCSHENVVPYANRAFALALRLSAPFRWRLRPSASLRWERRHYDAEADELRTPGGVVRTELRLRTDERRGGSAQVAARLGPCTLTLRYDASQLVTTFRDLSGSPSAPRGYTRQTIGLEAELRWL